MRPHGLRNFLILVENNKGSFVLCLFERQSLRKRRSRKQRKETLPSHHKYIIYSTTPTMFEQLQQFSPFKSSRPSQEEATSASLQQQPEQPPSIQRRSLSASSSESPLRPSETTMQSQQQQSNGNASLVSPDPNHRFEDVQQGFLDPRTATDAERDQAELLIATTLRRPHPAAAPARRCRDRAAAAGRLPRGSQ